MFINKNYIVLFSAVFALSICGTFLACQSRPFLPRPRGYFRISYRTPLYKTYQEKNLHYTFEYASNNASILKDSFSFFEGGVQNSSWRNIYFPAYKATIYLSYLNVNGTSIYKRKGKDGRYYDVIAPNSFASLLSQSYRLAYKHTPKAASIRDSAFTLQNKIGGGVFFDISGSTATKYQFFVTDTQTHYLRGVLYFDAIPNEDSLLPVNQFLAHDMRHLLNTLKWQ